MKQHTSSRAFLLPTARHVLTSAVLLLSGWVAQAQTSTCSPSRPEDFQQFFQTFAANRPFAIRRVIYPLQYLATEPSDPPSPPERSLVSKQEYATQPSINRYLQDNGLEYKIERIGGAHAEILAFKPDSGWLITYRFIVREGCWYLREIENHNG